MGVSTPKIRDYRAEDAEATMVVFQRAIRETASRDYDAEQVAAWSRVKLDPWAERRLSRPAWVAVVDGEVVGFTDLEPDGHLDMMFVHPAHNGRGIATALLARLEAAARAQGVERLYTEASITARPFFEQRGFVVDRIQEVIARDERFINYEMSKRLT